MFRVECCGVEHQVGERCNSCGTIVNNSMRVEQSQPFALKNLMDDSLAAAMEALRLEAGQAPQGEAIVRVGIALSRLLVAKNTAYGNSALSPLRVFARELPRDAQLRVRIDDKLSRIMRGQTTVVQEDTVVDLAGYLVLLLVHHYFGETID